MPQDRRTFYYNEFPVGDFLDDWPTSKGHEKFMAYRGPGHLAFSQALKAGDKPKCIFQKKIGDKIVTVKFIVSQYVDNGLICIETIEEE